MPLRCMICKVKVNLWVHLFLWCACCLPPVVLTAQSPDVLKHWQNLQLRNMSDEIEQNATNWPRERYWQYRLLHAGTLALLHPSEKHYENFNLVRADFNREEVDAALESFAKLEGALLELADGSEWSGFWQLLQSYKLARKAYEDNNASDLAQLMYGLHLVIFGVVPDKYQWLMRITGTTGDVVTGTKMLKGALNANNVTVSVLAEYALLLTQVYLLEKTPDRSLSLSDDTFMDRYLAAQCYSKMHEGSMALEEMQKARAFLSDENQFASFYYTLGELYLWKGDYARAIIAYHDFLKLRSQGKYVKDVYFKIALCHWFREESKEMDRYIALAKEYGGTQTEADKNADYYLKTDKWPARKLFEARFAFDGGYFTSALQKLKQLDINNLSDKDQVEYWYRLGRLHQATEKYEQAVGAFRKCIDLQGDTQGLYFAPNSWLQMGYIYRENNEEEKAIECFEQVLTYKDHPYAYSLQRKANIALKRGN